MGTWSAKIALTEADVESRVPHRGGVYRLMCQVENRWVVFYVGQSQDIETRLIEHLHAVNTDAGLQRCLGEHACQFRYTLAVSPWERETIESGEIAKWNPHYNVH